jgi:hypothetical protein
LAACGKYITENDGVDFCVAKTHAMNIGMNPSIRFRQRQAFDPERSRNIRQLANTALALGGRHRARLVSHLSKGSRDRARRLRVQVKLLLEF